MSDGGTEVAENAEISFQPCRVFAVTWVFTGSPRDRVLVSGGPVKGILSTAAVILFSGATMMAAEQTWVGEISDSACGAHHESGAENVPAPPAKECVGNCLRGGSTYVLVGPEHKVFQIAN